MAGALRAHDRQRRLGHPESAEHIGFDLVAGFLFADLLDGAEMAVAGIVDDDVEPAKALVRLGDSRVDGFLVGDVELDRGDVVAIFLDQISERAGVTGGRGNAVATRQRGLGPYAAKTLRRSGDEPNL